jgi:hypothetical protein
MNFPRIVIAFLSWQHKLHKRSFGYYSSESKAMHKTPWIFDSSKPRSLSRRLKQSKGGAAVFRRRWSPAARSKGRERLRDSRWSCCATCRGLGWPEREVSTRTRGGGGEVSVDGNAPVVNVGSKPAHELQ